MCLDVFYAILTPLDKLVLWPIGQKNSQIPIGFFYFGCNQLCRADPLHMISYCVVIPTVSFRSYWGLFLPINVEKQ